MFVIPIVINVVILAGLVVLILYTHNSIGLTICFMFLTIFFLTLIKALASFFRPPVSQNETHKKTRRATAHAAEAQEVFEIVSRASPDNENDETPEEEV